MPTIALDFASKRISVLPTIAPLYGTASYVRSRASGSSTAAAVGAWSGYHGAVGTASAAAYAGAVGSSFAAFGAGSCAGAATATAVPATTVAAVGSVVAQTTVCAAFPPEVGVFAGSAAGVATASAVSATLSTATSSPGVSAGAATVSAFAPIAAGTTAGSSSAAASANTIVAGAGTLTGVGTSVGAATTSATSVVQLFSVGSAAGVATVAGAGGQRTAVGSSAGVAAVSGVGASVATRLPFVINGHTGQFYGGGHLWAVQYGYDPGGGIGAFSGNRFIATADDGATWKTFSTSSPGDLRFYPLYYIEGTGAMIFETSTIGGLVEGISIGILEGSVSTFTGFLWWDRRLMRSNGLANAFNGRVSLSNAVYSGGDWYAIGADETDLLANQLQLWRIPSPPSDGYYFAQPVGNGVTSSVVEPDPTDPNKLTSGPAFGLTIGGSGATLLHMRSMSWLEYSSIRNVLHKVGSRWFWITGDAPTLWCNDNAIPTAGWRRIPLALGDGGRVIGFKAFGSYIVVWGSSATGNNVAWSSDNGSTWTVERPAAIPSGRRLVSEHGVVAGRLLLSVADPGSTTGGMTRDYLHTTDPSSGWTLRDSGGQVGYFVEAGSVMYATYSTGTSPAPLAKTTDGLTWTALPYPTT